LKQISSKVYVPLIILSFLIIAFLIVPGMILKNPRLSKTLTNKVENEVGKVFGKKVEIERLGMHGLFPELIGVKIDTADGAPMLEAEKIRISFDLVTLAFSRGSISNSIRRMDIFTPTLWMTKKKNGKLSFPKIIEGQRDPNKQLKINMVLEIYDGTFLIPTSEEKWPWGSFTQVYGEVDLRTFPGINGFLQCKSPLDPETTGEVRFNAPHYRRGSLEIKARNGTASFWGEKVFTYFGVSDEFQIKAGRTDIDLYFAWNTLEKKKFWFSSAKVGLEKAEAQWAKLSAPLKQVSTEFEFDATGINFNKFRGYYHQSLLDLKGRLCNGSETIPANADLKVYAKDLGIAEWATLVPSLKTMNASGRADLNLRIQGMLNKPQIRGEVLVKDGKLSLFDQGLQLTRVRLWAKLNGEEIDLAYAEGRLNEALFFMKGKVKEWDNPHLEMDFRVKQLQAAEFLQTVGLGEIGVGPVDGDLKISGQLAAPLIQGEVRTTLLQWDDFSAENLFFKGEYDWGRDRLKVDALNLRAFGGEGRIKGLVGSLRDQTILDLDMNWRGLDPERLPLSAVFGRELPPITGRANLRFCLDGPVSSPAVVCDLSLLKGSVERIEFDALDAMVLWDGEKATARLAMEKAGGTLIGDLWWARAPWTSSEKTTYNTGVEDDSYDDHRNNVIYDFLYANDQDYGGDFFLHNLDLDPQWLPPGMPPLQAKVSGSFGLQKKENRPVGEGWLQAHALELNDQPLGPLKLHVMLDGETIKISDSALLIQGNQLAVSGEFSWRDEPFYDLRVGAQDLPVQNLLKFVWPTKKPLQIEGLSALELSVRGWKDPVVSGELSAHHLSLYGFTIEQAEAGFNWRNQVLDLERLDLFQGGGKVRLEGKVIRDKLDLGLVSTDLPLASIKRNEEDILVLAGEKVTGNLNLDGRIQGALQEPVFRGELKVDTLNLAGLELDSITGKLNWKNSILNVDELLLNRGAQQVKAYGQVNLDKVFTSVSGKEPGLDLGLKMEETKVSDLLPIFGVSTKATVDGKVDGYLRVLGPLNQPLVRVISQVSEGHINGYTGLAGELDFQLKGETVTISRLHFYDREGEFAASGVYTPGNYLQASVRMNNFPLETIAALTDYEQSVDGRIDLQLDMGTNARGMEGVLTGGIRDASYNRTKIPSFHLNGRLQDDLLSLNYQGVEDKLQVWGNIPLNPQWFSPLDLPSRWPHKNQEWDVRLTATDLDALAFNGFFPENYVHSGTINGDLSLKGKWRDLYLQGWLDLKKVQTGFPGLPEEFRDVEGRLIFTHDYLRISDFKGRYGEGRFQTNGDITLNGLQPLEYGIKLDGSKLHYKNPLFDGLINAKVELTGACANPLLRGDVTLRKTRISLASLETGGLSELDFRFDLDVRAGSEVYFRQYGLANIPISGELHVGGTLSQPELIGEFTADRGSVTVYGDTFRIRTVRAEFKPEYLTMPYLELEADLYVSGTEIILSTQGWTGDDSIALQLTSNPVMSREEIFALLNWAEEAEESDGLFVAGILQGNINTVTDTLFGPFIDEFRDLMDIDYFSLERDRDLGNFRMNLGKSLDDDVYLSYSRSLTDLTQEVWTVEWQMSPVFSLIGDYTSGEGYEWQLLYRLMF